MVMECTTANTKHQSTDDAESRQKRHGSKFPFIEVGELYSPALPPKQRNQSLNMFQSLRLYVAPLISRSCTHESCTSTEDFQRGSVQEGCPLEKSRCSLFGGWWVSMLALPSRAVLMSRWCLLCKEKPEPCCSASDGGFCRRPFSWFWERHENIYEIIKAVNKIKQLSPLQSIIFFKAKKIGSLVSFYNFYYFFTELLFKSSGKYNLNFDKSFE